MGSSRFSIVGQILARLRGSVVSTDSGDVESALAEIRGMMAAQAAHLENQSALLAAMNEREAVLATRIGSPVGGPRDVLGELKRVLDALQVLYDEEPENRRRLHALRQTDEYELAYTEAEPLISVVIPTYRSFELLRDRALPSVLAQTYTNWEAVVVGDAAPPETAAVIEDLGDRRIRYYNQPLRGPYPEEEYDAWLVTAVPPFNTALRMAQGRWIAPFADDDELRPDALANVLADVQGRRHEFCYGRVELHARDGSSEVINVFPPRLAPNGIEAALQGALFHSGLRFFEQELADAIFRTPSDWSMIRRMMRAGVRFGFHENVVADYYPSYRGEDAPDGHPLR